MSHTNETSSVPVPETEESGVKVILNQLINESAQMTASHKLQHI